jgi:hypothetical protein
MTKERTYKKCAKSKEGKDTEKYEVTKYFIYLFIGHFNTFKNRMKRRKEESIQKKKNRKIRDNKKNFFPNILHTISVSARPTLYSDLKRVIIKGMTNGYFRITTTRVKGQAHSC